MVMSAMSMSKKMHQWTDQQDEVGQIRINVGEMFPHPVKGTDRNEHDQYNACFAPPKWWGGASSRMLMLIHDLDPVCERVALISASEHSELLRRRGFSGRFRITSSQIDRPSPTGNDLARCRQIEVQLCC